MVEMAIGLVVLLLLLLGIYDFGRAWSQWLTLQYATQQALRAAETGASDATITQVFDQDLQDIPPGSVTLAIHPTGTLSATSPVQISASYIYIPMALEMVGIEQIPMNYSLTGEVQ